VPADPERSKLRTKLARKRAECNLTQRELARLTGIGLSQLQDLERGNRWNPGIRWLTNCALVLECSIEEICEDEWLSWTVFDAAEAATPPTTGHGGPGRRG